MSFPVKYNNYAIKINNYFANNNKRSSNNLTKTLVYELLQNKHVAAKFRFISSDSVKGDDCEKCYTYTEQNLSYLSNSPDALKLYLNSKFDFEFLLQHRGKNIYIAKNKKLLTKEVLEDEIGEYYIGAMGTNKLKAYIPNFSYVYGLFSSGKDSKGNNKFTIIYEYVGKHTLLKVIPKLNETEMKEIFYQIMLAMMFANKFNKYRHGDFHTENIIIRDHGRIVDNYYPLDFHNNNRVNEYMVIKSRYTPYFIDYGYSQFEIEGVMAGINSDNLLLYFDNNITYDVLKLVLFIHWGISSVGKKYDFINKLLENFYHFVDLPTGKYKMIPYGIVGNEWNDGNHTYDDLYKYLLTEDNNIIMNKVNNKPNNINLPTYVSPSSIIEYYSGNFNKDPNDIEGFQGTYVYYANNANNADKTSKILIDWLKKLYDSKIDQLTEEISETVSEISSKGVQVSISPSKLQMSIDLENEKMKLLTLQKDVNDMTGLLTL